MGIVGNVEENNAKLRLLFLNALLGNGYPAEEHARLLKDKEETEELIKERGWGTINEISRTHSG